MILIAKKHLSLQFCRRRRCGGCEDFATKQAHLCMIFEQAVNLLLGSVMRGS